MFALYRAYIMVTHPKRLVFAGVFVVALAVTSYLPRFVQNALHHDHSISDGYDDSGSAGGMPDGAPASGAVSKEVRPDPSPARILQAVRDSLQRNDLQSAEVLLRAARALDINNRQALALQHELDARMTQSASPSTAVKGAVTPLRADSLPVKRTSRTATRTPDKRERAAIHTRKASNTHEELNTSRITPVETAAPITEAAEKPKSMVESVPEAAHAPAPVIVPPPVVQPTAQPVARPAPAPMVESSPGPKSREEVRAELYRARTDGSLPRFGNPDPAGPGVATISKPLAATPDR